MTRHSVAWSSAIGLFVGLAVMVTINQALSTQGWAWLSLRDYLDFWGVFFGAWAAVFVFGISVAMLSSPRARRWSLLFAAIVAALFGLLATNWNLLWGVPLTSLEGAWLWPLAIVPLVVSFLLFRHWRRIRSSVRPI